MTVRRETTTACEDQNHTRGECDHNQQMILPMDGFLEVKESCKRKKRKASVKRESNHHENERQQQAEMNIVFESVPSEHPMGHAVDPKACTHCGESQMQRVRYLSQIFKLEHKMR